MGPVTAHTAEHWDGTAWHPATLSAGYVGLCLPEDGVNRVTAQVGRLQVTGVHDPDTAPPMAFLWAFRLLSAYMADDLGPAGASSHSVNMGGTIQETIQRSPGYLARAMQNSGAGDMLRPYRRLK